MKLDAFKIFRIAITQQESDIVLDLINKYCEYAGQECVQEIDISCYNAHDYKLLRGLFNESQIWRYSPLWDTYIAYISEELDMDWSNDLVPYDGYLYNMFEEFIEEKYDIIDFPQTKEKMIDDWYEYQEDNKTE